jgi:hypothetical protein
MCIYPDKIRRRESGETGLASFITKIKVSSKVKSRILISIGDEKNGTRANRFTLFQPIPQPNELVDGSLQPEEIKTQPYGSQKFQVHTLLLLSTQIITYDRELTPQIDFFVDKLKLGAYRKFLKFSIHMNQEWIVELFSHSFEERCITSYFQTFHLRVTYLSKYKFYTNNSDICPVLKSVIILVGYSNVGKKSPELLKYLKHVAIVQLKKNMLNIRMSICQAMFIFSCYLLFQGLAKQGLDYFHQAYLMASALGIHKDMPRLNEMDKDERRLVRFTSYKHDYHLCGVNGIQPHYLFLAPSWAPLNPIYQTNLNSKDPNEFLKAECICLSIKCYNMYWTITANLLNKYSQLSTKNPVTLYKDNHRLIYIFETLLNHSLIRTLDSHLSLSKKCKNPQELEVVKSFAKMHVESYHNLIIIINSQSSIQPLTSELDRSTKKLLWSSQALYHCAIEVNPLTMPMLFHNLCSISLLYIKLILIYSHVPQLKELFLEKFKQVYILFNSYRSKYKIPTDMIEVFDIIVKYYKIKV